MVEVNHIMEGLDIPSNGRKLSFAAADIEKAYAHAKKELPNEACGLLGGVEEDGVLVVRELYLLTNIDASHDHFTMEPKEQLAAVKDMRAKGLKMLGNWHSHPESPSRPSEEDKRLAHDSNAVYCILSLMDEAHPVFNAFSVKNHTEVTHFEIAMK